MWWIVNKTPELLKNKKATINPKMMIMFFKCAVLPQDQGWKKLEINNKTVALIVLFLPSNGELEKIRQA